MLAFAADEPGQLLAVAVGEHSCAPAWDLHFQTLVRALTGHDRVGLQVEFHIAAQVYTFQSRTEDTSTRICCPFVQSPPREHKVSHGLM